MHLIESRVEFLPQEPGIEGIYKAIEKAGRTCYKSEDKITEDSAKGFVDRMIKSGHGAMLEHGTVYLFYSVSCYAREGQKWVSKYESNPYSKVVCVGVDDNEPAEDGNYYNLMGDEACGNEQYIITTNYRVLVENNWLDDLKFLCLPTEFHEKRYTMRFTCSRAIAQELTRHRKFSFSMESQRYINYSKERHGGEITFIKPSWTHSIGIGNYFIKPDYEKGTYSSNFGYVGYSQDYLTSLCEAENAYFEMLNKGCTPQQARDVLPNATKTELIMTGFSSDWKRLLRLRLFEETGKVHPDMKVLMEKLKAEAEKHGIWEDIMNKPSKFD